MPKYLNPLEDSLKGIYDDKSEQLKFLRGRANDFS